MTPLVLTLVLTAPSQPPGIPMLPPPAGRARPVRQPAQPIPQPLPGQPVPQLPQPQPLPTQPLPQTPVVLKLADFSRVFTPLPGKHDVWLLHPTTCQPVRVCFTLPPGKMKRFEVEDRSIEFEFDKCEVKIEFRKNGRVEIEYDD
jgi:hypothetical protein